MWSCNMKNIRVLDVTLRDGGCVNNFDFGQEYMDSILNSLQKSAVDVIELGYIDEHKGSEQGRTQYCNERVIPKYFLKHKNPNTEYVVMMDYGKFNVDTLQNRTDDGIDGIRLAFHKKNRKDIIEVGRKIIDKGYKFYIQPMITLRYSDKELLELIEDVNENLKDASGFYMVDSFGEMRGNDVIRLMHLIDKNLIPSMTLGFHSHNNLQLSYANAMSLLSFDTNRSLMLDSSVMGMGKGAGNLNTELLLEHLNLYYGKSYKIQPLLELIDRVIKVIHEEMYWGYSVEYYLSSINHCTPSYASHFYNRHMLSIDQVAELLGMIAEEKKISFDKDYAESLYLAYNERKIVDDEKTIDILKKQMAGRSVILIAPGKNILEKKEEIETTIKNKNVVSISLNNFEFDTDYVCITRNEMYENALQKGKKILVSSAIARNAKNEYQIDYKRWIILKNRETFDSSGAIMLNLISSLAPSKIILAGFDGFSADSNENYFDNNLRRPLETSEKKKLNTFYTDYIADLRKSIKIEFITKSIYGE